MVWTLIIKNKKKETWLMKDKHLIKDILITLENKSRNNIIKE